MRPVTVDREPPLRHVRLDSGPKNVLGIEAVRELGAALADAAYTGSLAAVWRPELARLRERMAALRAR